MSTPAQTDFPFVSLDFPGRGVLTVDEVADRLGVTAQHVIDLIDEGAIYPVADLGGSGASRRLQRIPIESYRSFILSRMNGPVRVDFLRTLPKPALQQLAKELAALLAA